MDNALERALSVSRLEPEGERRGLYSATLEPDDTKSYIPIL